MLNANVDKIYLFIFPSKIPDTIYKHSVNISSGG
jgi:hypothetical protein